MKSATSKVVTASDVSVVVLAVVAGVYCGLFGLRATQELNSRLNRVSQEGECEKEARSLLVREGE